MIISEVVLNIKKSGSREIISVIDIIISILIGAVILIAKSAGWFQLKSSTAILIGLIYIFFIAHYRLLREPQSSLKKIAPITVTGLGLIGMSLVSVLGLPSVFMIVWVVIFGVSFLFTMWASR